jgi:hypothetical protein
MILKNKNVMFALFLTFAILIRINAKFKKIT